MPTGACWVKPSCRTTLTTGSEATPISHRVVRWRDHTDSEARIGNIQLAAAHLQHGQATHGRYRRCLLYLAFHQLLPQ